MWNGHVDQLHLACFYAGCYDKLEVDENSDDHAISSAIRRRLAFSEKCLNAFGGYAVVVYRFSEFLSRAQNAAGARQRWYKFAPVEYYNPLSFHGDFSDDEAIFRKTMDYAYQQEYRIALNTSTDGDAPVTLDIGNLKDITLLYRSDELNRDFVGNLTFQRL